MRWESNVRNLHKSSLLLHWLPTCAHLHFSGWAWVLGLAHRVCTARRKGPILAALLLPYRNGCHHVPITLSCPFPLSISLFVRTLTWFFFKLIWLICSILSVLFFNYSAKSTSPTSISSRAPHCQPRTTALALERGGWQQGGSLHPQVHSSELSINFQDASLLCGKGLILQICFVISKGGNV